jgi:predicted secreted Zn-dependent protease
MPLQFRPVGVPVTPTRRLDYTTLRELARSSAGEELGAATFATSLTYATNAAGRISRVDLTFSLGIEMPVWTRYASRPEAERREWDRFYHALLEHERGHIAIFRREAQPTYARLLAATAATINSVLEQETARIQGLSDAYDRTTDHGRRQKSVHGTTVIEAPPAPD